MQSTVKTMKKDEVLFGEDCVSPAVSGGACFFFHFGAPSFDLIRFSGRFHLDLRWSQLYTLSHCILPRPRGILLGVVVVEEYYWSPSKQSEMPHDWAPHANSWSRRHVRGVLHRPGCEN